MTTAPVTRPAHVVDALSSTDPILWIFAGSIAMADAVAVWRLGWTINWVPFVSAGVTIALLVAVAAWFESRDAAWSRVAYAIALAMALAYPCQTFTYVLGTTGGAFRDLGRWDAWLGFSWSVWRSWVLGHPRIHTPLALIYPQHFASSALAVVVLALRTSNGANRFLRAFAVAFCVCAVAQVIVPALTNTPGAPSNVVRLALRDGSFHTLDFTEGVGLISFPSMHAALAVMVGLALWQFRVSRVPVAVFTALMLLAIPSEGGHYLVDVLAGAAVGLLAWRLARARVASFGQSPA
jgi:membrane-associated phospholipid phosphatase